ncbi:Eukaryotic translation initiation factor 4B3 [Nymphaea thermarum]|nr:Eukaryotic translation initiation factor 4B3 [Nymphaea thermarum]
MATTTASVWAKPGAWALEAEESEALEQMQQEQRRQEEAAAAVAADEAALADFPSLSMAAATKPARKKKGQTVSLSEFNTGKAVTHGAGRSRGSESVGLTPDELLMLPTGPRQRSPEELERSRLGGGFRSYGREGFSRDGGAGGDRGYGSGAGRGGGGIGGGAGGAREFTPSRADEIDDWGAGKKPLPERRERGFFESQSKADESDNWSSNKSRSASSGGGFGGYREREGRSRPGFEMFGGAAGSNSWGRKAEDSNGGAASDSWGRKTEDSNFSSMGSGGRPRLVLQPRTLPMDGKSDQPAQISGVQRTKGSNPFGAARPREEVLAEKGQDWKKIDEKLEAGKIKDVDSPPRLERNDGSFGRKDFGNGKVSSHDDRTGRTWRKPDSTDSPGRVGKAEDVEKAESIGEVEGATSN